MYQRVYNFLQDTHQICENQFGFRANHSCEHAIGQVVSSLVKNNENRKYRCCVLLDLSKAFDTIEHTILLNKLELYGIRGNALSWFKSYLTDRKLRVKCKTFSNMKEVRSKDFPIEYGTPQGSCLGPLIFLIFVNDLQLHLQFSESVQFADDTTLLLSHRNPTYLQFCVESELANIQDYFNANKLTLNVSKSMYILYHNQKTPPLDFRVKLNGIDLPRTNCAKLLGVWLDDKLKWDTHVNKLIHKLKSGLGMMRRSKNFLTPKAKRLLYFGQIHSNLSYALSIWGTMLQRSLIKKLNRLQKEAIRLINPKTLEIELYKKQKIPSFKTMIEIEQCKLGYKLCHSLLPKALTDSMTKDHQECKLGKVHKYHTRNKGIPNLPNITSTMYRSSFLFKSVTLYSKLDENIKNSSSVAMFVKRCKEWYASKH